MKKTLSKVVATFVLATTAITGTNLFATKGKVVQAAVVEKVSSSVISKEDEKTLREAIDKTTDKLMEKVSNPQVGSIGGEWAVIGVSRSNKVTSDNYYDDYYSNVENYVDEEMKKEKPFTKITDVERLVLALNAIGKDPTNVAGYNLIDFIWQRENLGYQGLNGYVFALLALDTKNYEEPENIENTRDYIIEQILNKKLPNGGFTFFGSNVDPDMTGMTLQALAKYKDRDDVKEAIDSSLKVLSDMQSDNGGFASWGTVNSESASQVLTALTALGLDPKDPSVGFVKENGDIVSNILSFYDGDGGFRHVQNSSTNAMATEQALYALVSYERLIDGKTSLYDMTDVVSDTDYEKIVDTINSTIAELKAAEEISLDNKETIDSLLLKYNNLKESYKTKVVDMDVLQVMKEEVDKESKVVEDLNADIWNKINPSNITIENEADVLDIIARYNALKDADKKYVENYEDVLEAKEVIDKLKEEKKDESSTSENLQEEGQGADAIKTGDNNNVLAVAGIMLLAAGVLIKSKVKKEA